MLERVAHFTILAKLGQGGMGVVFKAKDTKLRRAVALKLLPPEHVGDAERRARFMREARAAAAVTHANIATIYDVGEDEAGRVFIAMELVEGETLRARLAAGALSPFAALAIARQIARGLAKAHAAGLVHRDLKPDNVMVALDGDVKILDFGLAKARDVPQDLEFAPTGDFASVRLTDAGVILGTPGYMSPEQATGKVVEAPSDVFSFGVMLFEMLTHALPFRGRTVGELLASVVRDEARAIRELVPEIAPGLEDLVMRCLAKSAAERPADGAALALAIDALERRDGRSDAPAALARTEPAIVLSDPPPAVERPRSRRWIAAGIPAAVLALGVYVVATRKPPERVATADAATEAGPSAGVRLIDLPDPMSCNDAARIEYRNALEVSRSRGLDYGGPSFEKASKADPTCAQAHLRAALHGGLSDPSKREHYGQASIGRERLDPRDRELLAAFEPLLAREPGDGATTFARLREVVKKHPRDAELIILLGHHLWENDPDGEMIAFGQAAVEIDPGFTAAWQLLAVARMVAGDDEGGRKAFEQCATTIPSAIDCVRELAEIAKSSGKCEEMEAHARSFIARTPGDTRGYLRLAGALAADGGGREATAEALQQYASGTPARAKRVKLEEARLALAFGDFAAAEAMLAAVERGLEGSQDRGAHAGPAQLMFELHLETGRTASGLKSAEAFAARERVWTGPVDEFYGSPEEGLLLVPRMLALQLRAGKITRAQHDAQASTWFAKNVLIKQPLVKWVVLHGAWVETAADAERALAEMPTVDGGRHVIQLTGLPAAMVGRVLALGGRRDDGIAELRRFTQRCEVLDAPLAHTQAHLWLGEALEAAGRSDQACAAYRVVISRWGNARPASTSAQRAADRVKALSCPTP